jgi:hypothetical protein
MSFSFTLLLLLMLAVVGVLFTGLFSMIQGGEFNRKYGNKLMIARVCLQDLALLVLLLMVAVDK